MQFSGTQNDDKTFEILHKSEVRAGSWDMLSSSNGEDSLGSHGASEVPDEKTDEQRQRLAVAKQQAV